MRPSGLRIERLETRIPLTANLVEFGSYPPRVPGLDDAVQIGDQVYFVREDARVGKEVWKSGGTADSTRVLRDIVPGTGSSITVRPQLTRVGNTLLFVAYDGVNGHQLYRSDGTQEGTIRVSDFSGQEVRKPDIVGNSESGVFYIAFADGSFRLWFTSTTATEPTALTVGFASDSSIGDLTVAGNHILFEETAGFDTRNLWISDGTTFGTHVITGISQAEAESFFRFESVFRGSRSIVALLNSTPDRFFLISPNGREALPAWMPARSELESTRTPIESHEFSTAWFTLPMGRPSVLVS